MTARLDVHGEPLRELLDYCPESGLLTWKPREHPHWFNGKHAGKPAGNMSPGTCGKRYCRVNIGGRFIGAHRIAWAYVHGFCPGLLEVDHINGDETDNRIKNLRLVTHRENTRNRAMTSLNTSGFNGVHRDGSKWRAVGSAPDGKRVFLGNFTCPVKASEARAAFDRLNGFHPNHGRGRIVA